MQVATLEYSAVRLGSINLKVWCFIKYAYAKGSKSKWQKNWLT